MISILSCLRIRPEIIDPQLIPQILRTLRIDPRDSTYSPCCDKQKQLAYTSQPAGEKRSCGGNKGVYDDAAGNSGDQSLAAAVFAADKRTGESSCKYRDEGNKAEKPEI